MHIAVFGGTGRVGGRFIEYALAEGHTVRALVRDPAKLAQMLDQISTQVNLASQAAGQVEQSLYASDKALRVVPALNAAALERESAVAEERALLARELHDSIAQGLAFLKIQVQLLRGALRRGESAQVQRAVDELDAGLRESVADVRELLLHFRTRTNTDDFGAAIKTTLRKFQHQTGLTTHLHLHGSGAPLPPDVQVQLLHVVQEALSNVRKHAGASAVWVDVQQQPPWRVEVRDDGCGFEVDAAVDETHVGLRIMRERADGIGAQVQVRSQPGQGTCVTVELPQAQPLAA